jgi:hypothetical protein
MDEEVRRMKTAMSSNVLRFVIVAAVCAVSLAVAAEEQLRKQYSDEQLIDILRNDGYRAVERSDDRVITVKVDGLSYVLYVYDDDDLQMYFGVTGYVLDAEHMNEWNRAKRLSRAYLDDDGDPILEADLLANAGFTEEQFLEWFKVFNYSALEFRQFLIENDQAK